MKKRLFCNNLDSLTLDSLKKMNSIQPRFIPFISLLMFSPIATSNSYPNIKEFVHSGVSLGDTTDQVIEAITNFYSISVDDLEITTEYNGTTIEYIELNTNGNAVVAYFETEGDNSNILVLLTVNHEQPIESFDSYAEGITKKYGAPSVIFGLSKQRSHTWCEKINDDGTNCDLNYAMYLISDKNTILGTN